MNRRARNHNNNNNKMAAVHVSVVARAQVRLVATRWLECTRFCFLECTRFWLLECARFWLVSSMHGRRHFAVEAHVWPERPNMWMPSRLLWFRAVASTALFSLLPPTIDKQQTTYIGRAKCCIESSSATVFVAIASCILSKNLESSKMCVTTTTGLVSFMMVLSCHVCCRSSVSPQDARQKTTCHDDSLLRKWKRPLFLQQQNPLKEIAAACDIARRRRRISPLIIKWRVL